VPPDSYENQRLEDAITYLIATATQALSRTQLVKLLYFADLRSYELRQEPITGVNWRWHHFGPFAREIYAAVQTLDMRDELRVDVTHNYFGHVEYRLMLGTQAGYFGALRDDDRGLIESVLREFESIPPSRLAELSYYTLPMERVAQRGDELDFSPYRQAELPPPFRPDPKAPPPPKMTS
jgi:uncharacterized phage-associated protein